MPISIYTKRRRSFNSKGCNGKDDFSELSMMRIIYLLYIHIPLIAYLLEPFKCLLISISYFGGNLVVSIFPSIS